jgi:hypothetical protein
MRILSRLSRMKAGTTVEDAVEQYVINALTIKRDYRKMILLPIGCVIPVILNYLTLKLNRF